MAAHVPEARLMEALEGAWADGRAHLEACAQCQARLADAREGLARAREADVPEPSPLYWQSLRLQVRQAVEREGRRRTSFWRVALRPALAAAAVLAAIAMLVPRSVPRPEPSAERTLPAWSALPPAEDDPGLDVLRAVAPAVADAALPAGCAGLSECVADLSDAESRALAERLQSALGAGQQL